MTEAASEVLASPAVAKLKRSKRSPTAGPLVGTYGLAAEAFGFGRLSQLRLDSAGSRQLRSMNFAIDVWSV